MAFMRENVTFCINNVNHIFEPGKPPLARGCPLTSPSFNFHGNRPCGAHGSLKIPRQIFDGAAKHLSTLNIVLHFGKQRTLAANNTFGRRFYGLRGFVRQAKTAHNKAITSKI